MKNPLPFSSLILLLSFAQVAVAENSVFTYQGRLLDGGRAVDGIYDLRFTIYGSAAGPEVAGGPLTNAAVGVSNGLFTVMLDFGAGAFDGSARWLELGVRSNGSNGPYTVLAPRQAVTATPYAMYAGNAAVAGVATNLVPGGSIFGNGEGITNLSGANLQAGTVSSNAMGPTALALLGSGSSLSETQWIQATNSLSEYLYLKVNPVNQCYEQLPGFFFKTSPDTVNWKTVAPPHFLGSIEGNGPMFLGALYVLSNRFNVLWDAGEPTGFFGAIFGFVSSSNLVDWTAPVFVTNRTDYPDDDMQEINNINTLSENGTPYVYYGVFDEDQGYQVTYVTWPTNATGGFHQPGIRVHDGNRGTCVNRIGSTYFLWAFGPTLECWTNSAGPTNQFFLFRSGAPENNLYPTSFLKVGDVYRLFGAILDPGYSTKTVYYDSRDLVKWSGPFNINEDAPLSDLGNIIELEPSRRLVVQETARAIETGRPFQCSYRLDTSIAGTNTAFGPVHFPPLLGLKVVKFDVLGVIAQPQDSTECAYYELKAAVAGHTQWGSQPVEPLLLSTNIAAGSTTNLIPEMVFDRGLGTIQLRVTSYNGTAVWKITETVLDCEGPVHRMPGWTDAMSGTIHKVSAP